MTQKDRVFAALLTRDICVASVPIDLGYCMRYRCTAHQHDGPVFRYHLILPQPIQERLPIGAHS